MKVILNIEKRYAYAIIGLLLFLIGVVAVTAEYVNPATKVGHDASSVGAGTFEGDSYEFSQGVVRIGGYGNAKAGIINLRGGQADNTNLIGINNDRLGNLEFSSGGVTTFTIKKTGNIFMKDGATIYAPRISTGEILINGVSRTSWPIASVAEYLPGMHCGIYVAGAETDQGKTASNKLVKCLVNDVQYNPSVNCPAGFMKVGGDFEKDNYRQFFTCVKCINSDCSDATDTV